MLEDLFGNGYLDFFGAIWVPNVSSI